MVRNPLHPRVRDLMDAFLRCGDPHFGFLRLRCVNPGRSMKAERVLLRFQCVIRSYGALSTTVRRRLGWVRKTAASDSPPNPNVAVIEGEESEFVRVRRRSWARLISKVWLDDPARCPSCGKEMKILAAVSSPAQDRPDRRPHLCVASKRAMPSSVSGRFQPPDAPHDRGLRRRRAGPRGAGGMSDLIE